MKGQMKCPVVHWRSVPFRCRSKEGAGLPGRRYSLARTYVTVWASHGAFAVPVLATFRAVFLGVSRREPVTPLAAVPLDQAAQRSSSLMRRPLKPLSVAALQLPQTARARTAGRKLGSKPLDQHSSIARSPRPRFRAPSLPCLPVLPRTRGEASV